MKVAALSDTHGNLTAYQAVLADIDARGADQILHLGDVAGKGPRGAACCALTRQRCDVTVRGNWDAMLTRPPNEQPTEALRWWRRELTGDDLGWLARLPFAHDLTLAGTHIRVYHASSDGLFHRIYPIVDGDEWEQLFANTPETGDGDEPDVVIYGDIHFAFEKSIGSHTLINCGSVGNPLDMPVPSYLMLDDESGTLQHELIRVPYDIEAELAAAREVDMPTYDMWEHELRTAEYAR